jgi:hypothetical protein
LFHDVNYIMSLKETPSFFLLVSWVGWDWVHLVRRPLIGLLYQPRIIDDECGVGGIRIGRGNRSIRRKPAPVSLCPPQTPQELTWSQTRAAALGSRRLTAWAMARPQRNTKVIDDIKYSTLCENKQKLYNNTNRADVLHNPSQFYPPLFFQNVFLRYILMLFTHLHAVPPDTSD